MNIFCLKKNKAILLLVGGSFITQTSFASRRPTHNEIAVSVNTKQKNDPKIIIDFPEYGPDQAIIKLSQELEHNQENQTLKECYQEIIQSNSRITHEQLLAILPYLLRKYAGTKQPVSKPISINRDGNAGVPYISPLEKVMGFMYVILLKPILSSMKSIIHVFK